MEPVGLSSSETVKVSLMLEQLIYGSISLSQLPVPLASFYYLGEATHIPEVLELRTQLAQAELIVNATIGRLVGEVLGFQ
jgi:hypothetical protein